MGRPDIATYPGDSFCTAVVSMPFSDSRVTKATTLLEKAS